MMKKIFLFCLLILVVLPNLAHAEWFVRNRYSLDEPNYLFFINGDSFYRERNDWTGQRIWDKERCFMLAGTNISTTCVDSSIRTDDIYMLSKIPSKDNSRLLYFEYRGFIDVDKCREFANDYIKRGIESVCLLGR